MDTYWYSGVSRMSRDAFVNQLNVCVPLYIHFVCVQNNVIFSPASCVCFVLWMTLRWCVYHVDSKGCLSGKQNSQRGGWGALSDPSFSSNRCASFECEAPYAISRGVNIDQQTATERSFNRHSIYSVPFTIVINDRTLWSFDFGPLCIIWPSFMSSIRILSIEADEGVVRCS